MRCVHEGRANYSHLDALTSTWRECTCAQSLVTCPSRLHRVHLLSWHLTLIHPIEGPARSPYSIPLACSPPSTRIRTHKVESLQLLASTTHSPSLHLLLCHPLAGLLCIAYLDAIANGDSIQRSEQLACSSHPALRVSRIGTLRVTCTMPSIPNSSPPVNCVINKRRLDT